MQLAWLVRGLRTGILTTRYPYRAEVMPTGFRGRPVIHPERCQPEELRLAAEVCPTAAIGLQNGHVDLDLGRCIQCGLCVEAAGAGGLAMVPDHELSVRHRANLVVNASDGVDETGALQIESVQLESAIKRLFKRSLHIRHVDAGSCNACESEIKQLTSPYYDLHRLGIFFSTSPRHADALLVTGPVTSAMEAPLRRTYEAMPEPKLVVAVGACACSGGIFADGPVTHGGVAGILPVDVFIPGCPPSPLALIHGLLLAIGRIEQRLVPSEASLQ